MIRFENDSIDESEEMKDVIQEGKTLLRMKVRSNPRVEIVPSWYSAPFVVSAVVVVLPSFSHLCFHSIQLFRA